MSAPYSQTEVENVMRIVRLTVSERWAGTSHYGDILAEGYWRAWQRYQAVKEQGHYQPTTAAFWVARQAPASWLRRWQGEGRRGEIVSLDEMRERAREQEWLELDHRSQLPAAADFAPAVTVRLEVRAWLSFCRPRERLVLERVFLQGWSRARCAAALGVSVQRIDQLQARGIARIREHLGLPAPSGERSPRGRRYAVDTPERQANRERMAAYRQRLKERRCSVP